MGPPPDREPDADDRRTLERREVPMRLIEGRAAGWRGFACMLAVALCLGSVITGVRAQEMPAGGPAAIASAGEPVLLREHPGYDAVVLATLGDRKSTRLNSSHGYISYAVFCLKKKNKTS